MRTLLTAATLVAAWAFGSADRGRPVQENRPADQGGRGRGQGTVEVPRRQDRRGRRQGPRRQAQQDLQHRAQGREGADFDDSKWEVIAPETLKNARSTGQVCFCWYRIKITIPPEAAGKAVFFRTTVDDYGEIWVDGKLPRTPGKGGEADRRRLQRPQPRRAQGPQAGQGLPDRGLRHQRADLGGPVQLDLPQEHGPRIEDKTVTVNRSIDDPCDTSRNQPVAPGTIPKRRGKVRDVYDLGDRLLLVATDRISAFDWVLPNGIPDKGRVLTGLSVYWFDLLEGPQPPDLDRRRRRRARSDAATSASRSRAARWWCARPGSFRSSAWCVVIFPAAAGRNIAPSGTVCGIKLAAGLVESERDRADLHAGHQGRDRPR